MSDAIHLLDTLKAQFREDTLEVMLEYGEITLEVDKHKLHAICLQLRDAIPLQFTTLVDLCGVDYQDYGCSEWTTTSATGTGFDRGVRIDSEKLDNKCWKKLRFAVTYHLLSTQHNHRLRLRAFTASHDNNLPSLSSVADIWPAANWYEREAFDLYGIWFMGHPDLRRLLTDYGFEGHPFRKDFPLIGKVEVHYDAVLEKVVYAPVTSVTPRNVIPKVIRSKVEADISESSEYKEPH
jgi:NADH-quinone oxidoreductase subunit C